MMKRYFLLLMVVSGYCYGQNEFMVHANGLIYDDATMKRLGVIVDSLNIKFRTCDAARIYYSHPQGMAVYVEVPNAKARRLIGQGITLNAYTSKFLLRAKSKKSYIIKTKYKDYKEDKWIEYASLPSGRGEEISVTVKNKRANDKVSGWVIADDGTSALYLERLNSIALPAEYARLVQYVDCMVDTTTDIYLPEAKREGYASVKDSSAAAKFIDWAESYPGRPVYPDYDELEKANSNLDSAYNIFHEKMCQWDSVRTRHIDAMINTSAYWRDCLATAAKESLKEGNSDERLEFYVARYYSKQDALKLMRSRRVVGGCSQDQRPRYHAMNICRLSAETAQWDVFLRSHLNIMNDRFERMSDGSYAWAGRKTYLKELEELDINAVDLLLGTCLRVDNVSKGHYWGSINRVGRALSDSENKKELEDRLTALMKNEQLDLYNRLLIAYLFSNYAYSLSDEAQKQASLDRMNQTITSMPAEIREIWKKAN